jgi:hypothetical protein
MLQDRRLTNRENVKLGIVKEVTDAIEQEEEVKRKMINDRLRNALKVYSLFEEIGIEKIERIRETSVNTIT